MTEIKKEANPLFYNMLVQQNKPILRSTTSSFIHKNLFTEINFKSLALLIMKNGQIEPLDV